MRVLAEGEFDAEDDQYDGVEEEEEVDDGVDIVREDQQKLRFDSIANQIGSLSADAIQIAQSMAAESDVESRDGDRADDSNDDEADGSSSDSELGDSGLMCWPAGCFRSKRLKKRLKHTRSGQCQR